MAVRSPLELIAIPSDGSDGTFDGTPLAPGVHLRWSFWPELGWPEGGFEVQRRGVWRNEFEQLTIGEWATLATLNLPPPDGAANILISRARTVTTGSALASYERETDALRRLIERVRLRSLEPVDATRGSSRVSFSAIELLQLASLDPYAARALGLAYIDGKTAPHTPMDYRIVGHWGARQGAFRETLFNSIGELPAAAMAKGQVTGVACSLTTGRALSLVPAERPTQLRLDGVGALTLSVLFSTPAREVELELAEPTAAVAGTRWTIRGRSANHELSVRGTGLWRLNVAVAGSRLVITSPAERLIDELIIADTFIDSSTWRIIALRHRSTTGAIGRMESSIARVSPLADPAVAISEPHFDVTFPPPAVVTPALARTIATPLATEVADDGQVRPASSQLEAFLTPVPAPPVDRPGLTRPARLHAGYIRAAGAGGAGRIEYVTMPLPAPGPTLETVGSWRLDGALTGLVGPSLTEHGSVSYVGERLVIGELDMRRRTVRLTGRLQPGENGPGYLEAADVPGLDRAGNTLHVQLWVHPTFDAENYPTLVGNNHQKSFWLGLAKRGTVYIPRFWLNNQSFEAAGTIAANQWSHLAVYYDGRYIHFFVNGVLDVSRAAALGAVRPNPRRRLCIGCDPSDATAGQPAAPFAYPFAGFLADVQVRSGSDTGFAPQHRKAAWSFNGDLRDRETGAIAGTLGAARFATDHPEFEGRSSIELDGTWCALANNHPLAAAPGRRICARLRVKPTAGLGTAVMVGTRQWAISLQTSGDGYAVVLTIGGRRVTSTELLKPGRWGTILAAADGDRAVIYVDGRPTQSPLDYGKIPSDREGVLMIGAAATSSTATLVTPFRGLIADLEIGDTVPGPCAPVVLVDQERTALLNVPPWFDPGEPDRPRPADAVARQVEPGRYRFFVAGVDLFGRLGPARAGSTVEVTSAARPLVPGGARARFLPILGLVSEVTPPSDPELDPSWAVGIILTRPTSVDAATAGALLRHDGELTRVETVPNEPGRLRVARAERHEIVKAAPGMTLALLAPALPRLRPQAGQRVTIEHDRWVRAEWTWTGTQRLLAPHVERFWLWERRREGSDAWTPWVRLGDHAGIPVVTSDIVVQNEVGPSLGARVVDHTEWAQLCERAGVLSLPEPADPSVPPDPDPRRPTRRPRSRIWKVHLDVRNALAASPVRRSPHGAPPDEFVPGALVAYNSTPGVQAWQLFTVLHHEFSTGRGWDLYFVENSKGRDPLPLVPPFLVHARYYPGQRYHLDALLDSPVAFGERPTVPMEVAVDTTGAVTGLERSADLVAIDRRRPPRPPAPNLELGPADYHGRSRARVWWTLPEPAGDWRGVAFQVHRATENAVFARDLEQRRRSREPAEQALNGHYAALTPDEIMADDPDFEVWLAECFPDWMANWRERLFVPKPADSAAEAEQASWRRAQTDWTAATAVWFSWMERFYPALRPGQIQEIAEREGNESAFGLVNAKPVAGTEHIGEVNGTVTNRYLARLRSQAASLAQSIRWSRVSTPVRAPTSRPARPPLFVGVRSGDRQIALQWRLSPEANVREYRLYRARTAEELEDLRWWTDGSRERRVLTQPDPRLRTVGNSVSVPAGLGVAEIVAVRAGTTFNHYRPDRGDGAPSHYDAETRTVHALSPLPDGTPVTVAYQDSSGAVRVAGDFSAGLTYVDRDLPSLGDYHYRLEAVDEAGFRSEGSTIVVGRALDTRAPAPPRWLEAAPVLLLADDSERPLPEDSPPPDGSTPAMRLVWHGTDPDVRYLVTRKARGERAWRPVNSNGEARAIADGTYLLYDRDIEVDVHYSYRIKVISAAGFASDGYRIIETRPR